MVGELMDRVVEPKALGPREVLTANGLEQLDAYDFGGRLVVEYGKGVNAGFYRVEKVGSDLHLGEHYRGA